MFREPIEPIRRVRRRLNNPNAPLPDLLNPHGQQWSVIEEKLEYYVDIYPLNSVLKWPKNIPFMEKKALDYFKLMFPKETLQHMVQATSESLEANAIVKTTTGEIFKYIGIRLAMCIDPVRGGYAEYWATSYENSVKRPRNYGATFKMSKNRFEAMTSNLRLKEEDRVQQNAIPLDQRV
jgi:hypothetical protein